MISLAVSGFTKLKRSRVTALICILAILFSACQPVCYEIEPNIPYFPQKRQLKFASSAFEKLSNEELREEWARELHIGLAFGHDLDLYRAITAFKRAAILLPPKRAARRPQIEYCIFESYYLGRKFADAIETYESGTLFTITPSFPAYKELNVMLYECYIQEEQLDKAATLLENMRTTDPETASRLEIWSSFLDMDFAQVSSLAATQPDSEEIDNFLGAYTQEAKSVRRARALNALLPGAGYAYVGQKQTAVTSFLINALFTGASYYCFKNGNVPAGIILASFESGWYLGGINGAGLAAQAYNKSLYEQNGKELLVKERLIPFLMLQTTF